MERWLVTGGAGFIGSNFILAARREKRAEILNLDRLTYAGNTANLESLESDPGYRLLPGDIADRDLVRKALADFSPAAVFHFAAESHVDRSIEGPAIFLRTNVEGTFSLLEESRRYFDALPSNEKGRFRFLHVSTDEVFGSLSPSDPPFNERTPYAPNSPYAASKAASDHFVRAWFHTYGLPVLTTNCSNNYGPFQFPEKLVPTAILSALKGKDVPVYGDGMNIRDWLFVEDHCQALFRVHERGVPGETYNVGGGNERTNLQMVSALLTLLDKKDPVRTVCPIWRESGSFRTVRDMTGDMRSTVPAFIGSCPGHLPMHSTRRWKKPLTGISTTRPGGRLSRLATRRGHDKA